LTEETINNLEIQDVLAAEMGQLSLNALSGTDSGDAMRIRALVHNKTMLILVDSESSHSFVNASFMQQIGVHPSNAKPLQVKVANGGILMSNKHVQAMEWWTQGVYIPYRYESFEYWSLRCYIGI
jgi:hypothetical protein